MALGEIYRLQKRINASPKKRRFSLILLALSLSAKMIHV